MTANEPSLTRNFVVTPSQVIAQQASVLATNKLAFRSFINAIGTAATLRYQCDGTTAGTPGDGVQRILADANVVFADSPTAHSWAVYRFGTGLSSIEILVEAVLNGGTTGDIACYLSHAGFTGGSAGTAPTVGGGDLKLAIATTLGPLLPTTNYAAHYHFETTADGSAFRLIAQRDSTHAVTSMLLVEKLSDAPAALYLPIAAVWHSNDQMADLSVSANRLFGYSGATTSFAGNMTIDGATSGPLTGAIPKNDLDGKRVLFPTIAWDSSHGYLGAIADLWWSVNDTTTHDTTIPSGTVRHWACFGEVTIPWDSTTDLGNGTTNAHPVSQGAAAAAVPLLKVTPDANTPLGSTFDEGRWVPIVVEIDVPPGYGAHADVQVGTSGPEFVAYRRGAFSALFTTLSVATIVGSRVQLSILPLGGWWDAPSVSVGAYEEAT